jgi:hypothetical protein
MATIRNIRIRAVIVEDNMKQCGAVLYAERTQITRNFTMFFSAFCIRHGRQTGGARAGGRDFGSNSVAQPRSVKPVAIMSDVFDCLQVHYRMPSDLDERIAA